MQVCFVPDDSDSDLLVAGEWLAGLREERLVVTPTRGIEKHPGFAGRIARRYPRTTKALLYSMPPHRGAVLAFWPDRQTLELIQDWSPTAICVIPGNKAAISGWLTGLGAIDLTDTTKPESASLDDRVIVAAMSDVTGFINMNNRLVQQEDRDWAIETLALLARHGHHVLPTALYAWALANGWPGDTASQLLEYATRIADGHRYRTSEIVPREDSYRSWVEEAGQSLKR